MNPPSQATAYYSYNNQNKHNSYSKGGRKNRYLIRSHKLHVISYDVCYSGHIKGNSMSTDGSHKVVGIDGVPLDSRGPGKILLQPEMTPNPAFYDKKLPLPDDVEGMDPEDKIDMEFLKTVWEKPQGGLTKAAWQLSIACLMDAYKPGTEDIKACIGPHLRQARLNGDTEALNTLIIANANALDSTVGTRREETSRCYLGTLENELKRKPTPGI